MTSIERTGKTVEEAVAAACADLGVAAAQVDVVILEEASKGIFGFIGTKPARIRATVKDDVGTVAVAQKQGEENGSVSKEARASEVAEKFLQDVLATMKLAVTIERTESDGAIVFNLRGSDLGVLIGKRGQTLDALQYLTNLAANRGSEGRQKFVIDVENYRQRRAETLMRLAERLADKVKRQGEPVVLEPMTPMERKIIHMTLQDDRRVATYSEGEEPNRKVVIALKKG